MAPLPSIKAFTLPPAVWLPHTSFLPFSVVLFFFTALLLGGYILFHFLAHFEIKWWMTASWLGGASLFITVFVEVFVIRRINFLSAVVQQDPRLVAGDAVAFALMKQYPRLLGRSREMDTLQKSLVNLYRASFKGRNIVYDGFTQQSVISCDYDVSAEQRPFGVDVDADYEDTEGGSPSDADNWENRSWYERDDDGLEEGVDRDKVDILGGNSSSLPFLGSGSKSAITANTNLNSASRSAKNSNSNSSNGVGFLSLFSSSTSSPSKKASLVLSGDSTAAAAGGSHSTGGAGRGVVSFSGGARSLQRALLLSGIDPANYVPATPRGSSSNDNNNNNNNFRSAFDTNNDYDASSFKNVNGDTNNNNYVQNDSGMSLQEIGGNSYGSTASSGLISSRSQASNHSCVTVTNSNSNFNSAPNSARSATNTQKQLFSPRDILLCEVSGASGSASADNFRRYMQSQPPFMLFDPLGDNNSSVPFDVLMQGIPDTGTSLLVSIVKQISPGTPLSAITFPVHVLEPRSLLEKFADMFRHSSILVELVNSPNANDSAIRIQHLTKFFLSAYYLQQGARKPYNPIHGEVFGARLELPHCNGKAVYYLAEQVSHHPPITFIRAVCPGVFEFRAVYHAKTSLVSINCASSVGEGSMELTLFDPKTGRPTGTYSMSWPTLFVSGFLYGAMRLELGSTTHIIEKTGGAGARAKVDFARKGWISGQYDVVHASFAADSHSPIDEVNGPAFEGHWNREIYFLSSNSNKTSRVLAWDGPSQKARSCARLTALNVPNCPRQSRAIWQRLTQALRHKDVARSVEAKHEVEEAQRTWRKAIAAKGDKHQPKMFAHANQNLSQFPQQDLWDLSKWQDTEDCKRWFQSQVADVEIH